MTDQDVSQYLIHPALRPRLDKWLIDQGFRIDLLPLDDDSLPTYLVAPGERLMRTQVWWLTADE